MVGGVDGREEREREGGEHEPEVAQRDVVKAGVSQEVDDDPGEPAGDDVGAVAGFEGDDDAGEDLGRACHGGGREELTHLLTARNPDRLEPR